MKSCVRAFLIFSILIILFGCSNQTISEERATFAEQNREVITIGVAWPFESANDLFWEGVELAVNEINENGGVLERQIEIVKRDDQATVTKGLEIAQEFAENEKITAVIGHRNSYVSIPVSSIYERAGVLMLSPASSSPELIHEDNKLIFRNIASDDKVAEELAKFAYKNKHRKIVIIYDDDDYGKGLANAFEKYAGELGFDIVDRLSYYSGLSELTQLKYKWENLQYDGIFIAKSNPEGAKLITELRNSKIDVPLFAGNAMDTSDIWNVMRNEDIEGTVFGSFFNPESTRQKVTRFMTKFQEKYERTPTQYSVQGYDAVYLLIEAIKNAETTVPEKIATALREMDDYEGVAGIHNFGGSGNDIGELVVIKQAKNGKFDYLSIQ